LDYITNSSLCTYISNIYYEDLNLFYQCNFHIHFANSTDEWFYYIMFFFLFGTTKAEPDCIRENVNVTNTIPRREAGGQGPKPGPKPGKLQTSPN
jgi:hypothetical protein